MLKVCASIGSRLCFWVTQLVSHVPTSKRSGPSLHSSSSFTDGPKQRALKFSKHVRKRGDAENVRDPLNLDVSRLASVSALLTNHKRVARKGGKKSKAVTIIHLQSRHCLLSQ